MTLCDGIDLIWTQEFTSLGINFNVSKLNQITELDLKPEILEMEKLSSFWNCRILMLIGKTTIIKTLMISKIIHVLLSLPSSSDESFKDIENIFLKFHGKTNLRNLKFQRKIDMIMKASWLKRIFKSDEGWAAIPNFYELNMIYTYGDVFLQKKTRNLFAIHFRERLIRLYNLFISYTIILP